MQFLRAWWGARGLPAMGLALCAAVIVGLSEGIVALALSEAPRASIWSLPLATLGLDLLAFFIFAALQLLPFELLRWVYLTDSASDRPRRLASFCLAALGAGGLGYLAVMLMMTRLERITTRPFATALVGFAVALAVVLGLLLAKLVDELRVRTLAKRWPHTRDWPWPVWVASFTWACGLALMVATLQRWWYELQSFRALLWLLVFVAVELGLLFGLWLWSRGRQRLLALVRTAWGARLVFGAPLIALLGVQGLLALHAPLAAPLLAAGGVASKTLSVLRKAADFDGDGYAGLLAGGDCAEFDQTRHPTALDVPANSIDENCDGVDARQDDARNRRALAINVPPEWRQARNVIIISIDALRADHVGFLGYQRGTTPYLDRLAAQSWVFTEALAPSSTTRQSLPVLMSGRYASGLAWRRHEPIDQLRKSNVFLAEVLKAEGFKTIAVVDEWLPAFLPSLKQGFDSFAAAYGARKWKAHGQSAAPFTNIAALEQLFALRHDQRFLLYLHYEAPHFPYVAHVGAANFGERPVDLYDAEISYVDQYVGQLLEMLEAKGSLEKSLIVVLGDHGQEFLEHGGRMHSRNLHVESVHVPLLLRVPGAKAGRFDGRVSLLDVVPTLMDLLPVRSTALRPQGISLVRRVRGEKSQLDRPLLGELLVLAGGRRDTVKSLYLGRHKLIWDFTRGEKKLYDVALDPGEQKPLQDKALIEKLSTALQAEVARAAR